MSAVIARRLARTSLLALAAVAATGCATFTDNDVVARVGDAELSSTDLEQLLGPVVDPADPGATQPVVRADGETARGQIAEWVRRELLKESGIAERYAADPAALGVACIDVIVSASEGEARSILGQLANGGDWDELAAPAEANFSYDSHLQCQPHDTFTPQVSPNFAEFLAGLEPGGGADVVDLGTGQFAVVRVQPIDAIDTIGMLTILQGLDPALVEGVLATADTADVYVDPRFGGFDAASLGVAAVN